jgi:uncharacterized protein YxjI
MLKEHLQEGYNFSIIQQKEIYELIGLETRNKYSLQSEYGEILGFAAEISQGLSGFLMRQILGHWRTFTLKIFDNDKKCLYSAHHPFRIFFSRLEVIDSKGMLIGVIQQRFSFIYKRFDLLDANDNLVLKLSAPIWKPWTYPFFKKNQKVAVIFKKWSGFLKEAFTDSDNFRVEFHSKDLTMIEKELILVTTLLIDIVYFERKASSRSSLN